MPLLGGRILLGVLPPEAGRCQAEGQAPPAGAERGSAGHGAAGAQRVQEAHDGGEVGAAVRAGVPAGAEQAAKRRGEAGGEARAEALRRKRKRVRREGGEKADGGTTGPGHGAKRRRAQS